MEKEEIKQKMNTVRRSTLSLFHDIVLEEENLHKPLKGFRPLIWHLGHIGVFEAHWLLQRRGQSVPLTDEYMRIFDPIKTPRGASKGLPSLETLTDVVGRVRALTVDQLERASWTAGDPLPGEGYVFDMVLQHEQQHQETICYLLHLLPPVSKRRPASTSGAPAADRSIGSGVNDMVLVPGGEFELGATGDHGFVYDNELPPHTVSVRPFRIDRQLVTCAVFQQFIDSGGYDDPAFWDAQGWAWRQENKVQHPLHWFREGHQWFARSMFDLAPVEPQVPVYGVSWYEARAYARFVGKRLPTEAEWVAAAYYDRINGRMRSFPWGWAEPDERRANFGNQYWKATPVGSFPQAGSPVGCLDMAGNVWEWTDTVFDGYSGFQPHPYPQYSQIWFDGDHRVLKGGSWATSRTMMRSSFRNFFRREFRVAFAGFRCATSSSES